MLRGAAIVGAAASERSELRLSLADYLFLLGVVCGVVLCLDPLNLKTDPNSAIKHLIIALVLAASVLNWAGSAVATLDERGDAPWSAILQVAWPLVLVSSLIVAGSLYARIAEGIDQTFLNVGLYMSLVLWSGGLVAGARACHELVRAYFGLWIIFAVLIGLSTIWQFAAQPHTAAELEFSDHELEYAAVPLAVFFAIGTPGMKPVLRITGFLYFVSLAFFFKKNTGYLVGLITLTYLAVVVWRPRINALQFRARILLKYLLLLACLLAAAAMVIMIVYREQLLPSGNVAFRAHTYARAWELFLQSPLWGNFWSGPAVAKFTLFETGHAGEMLPTHSDVLDLLANGGLVGLALFVFGCLRITKFVRRRALAATLGSTRWTPYAHALACSCLSALPVIAFNPILLRPSRATFLWINLGVLLAMGVLGTAEKTQHAAQHKN